jgi:hypothetical protein
MTPATAPSLTAEPTQASAFAIGGNWNRVFEIAISVLIGAGFFLLLRATPDLPGGTDGYRHVTQAWRLIHEPKAMFADPWHLAYLWHKPVDPWFGYHLLLAPFVYLFEPITAIKLLTSVIFGLIAYAMFLLLRHVGASHRTFWVLLAMTGSSMTLGRATTVRPFLLSVLLTLLAALFTVTDKPIKLALVSLIHALSYSIFFLVGIAPGLWFLLRRDRRSTVNALCCGAGLALGLLINPYFPENVRFDVVQASVVNIARAAHVKIAGELAPADSWWCIVACLPAALPWIGAVILRLSRRRGIVTSPVTNLLLVISSITLLETLHIVRTADFFIPFAVLFAAATLTPYLKASRADVAVVGLLLALPCAANVYLTHAYVVDAPVLERFRGASAYLKANAPDALVLNTGWAPDYFFLFFYNSRSRYVIGIEPTFLYLSDHRKYWLWRHMNNDEAVFCDRENCAGAEHIDIASAARNELGAQYIVTDHENSPVLDGILRKNAEVTEVYRDNALSVYRVDAPANAGAF